MPSPPSQSGGATSRRRKQKSVDLSDSGLAGAGLATGKLNAPGTFEQVETVMDVTSDAAVRTHVFRPRAKNDESQSVYKPVCKNFTIMEKIGEGGHGIIWNAVQRSLNRRIAVKSLKAPRRLGTSKSQKENALQHTTPLERIFRQEAMTAAFLEHPNIIPVHDLGIDEFGRPLLAMKLVEGRQWNEVLAEDFTRMPAHEFLSRHIQVLINVAKAVAFAHGKGIIHRDLKPPQVMLGKFGEVLLMDWGLAMGFDFKVSHPEVLAIAYGDNSPLLKPVNPAGTPGYMAPEQTVSKIDGLGPWTDVYLLGAVLYEMLTGFRPHQVEGKSDIFAAARQNKVINPEERTPDRDIPSQLSSLAMKAMRTKPADRPHSVEEFLATLQDYITSASARHSSMTMVTSVALNIVKKNQDYELLADCHEQLDRSIALWPGNHMANQLRFEVTAVFAHLALHHRDLRLARLHAQRMRDCAEKKNLMKQIGEAELESIENAAKVEQALAQAKAARERAENMVRFLLGDLHKELRTIGRLELISRVTGEALKFFDSLSEVEAGPESLHNRCVAYFHIGDVLNEQGRRNEADGAFQKAAEIAANLALINPGYSRWQALLADSLDRRGNFYDYMGRSAEAIASHEAAFKIRKALTEKHPGNRDFEANAASTRHALGLAHWRNQNIVKALELVSGAVAESRRLAHVMPSDIDAQSAIATYVATLANIQRDRGNLEEAMQLRYESLGLRIALAEQHPGNDIRMEAVLWSRAGVALLLFFQGKLDEALEMFRGDLPDRRRLYGEDNNNVVRLSGLAFQLSYIGEILFLQQRLTEAEPFIAESLYLGRKLDEVDKETPASMANLARLLVLYSEFLIVKGNWEEPRELVKLAVEKSRHAWWISPSSANVCKSFVGALVLQARLLKRDNHPDEAAAHRMEALGILDAIQRGKGQLDLMKLMVKLELVDQPTDFTRRTVTKLRRYYWVGPYMEGWLAEKNVAH